MATRLLSTRILHTPWSVWSVIKGVFGLRLGLVCRPNNVEPELWFIQPKFITRKHTPMGLLKAGKRININPKHTVEIRGSYQFRMCAGAFVYV